MSYCFGVQVMLELFKLATICQLVHLSYFPFIVPTVSPLVEQDLNAELLNCKLKPKTVS